MSIVLDQGSFVATCDDNRFCMSERRVASQTQRPLEIDTTAPAIAGEVLHADDGKIYKKRNPLEGLSKEERRQLEMFRATLERDGWIVKTDRSQPLGLAALCRYHNPATVWPRPPPELDW